MELELMAPLLDEVSITITSTVRNDANAKNFVTRERINYIVEWRGDMISVTRLIADRPLSLEALMQKALQCTYT